MKNTASLLLAIFAIIGVSCAKQETPQPDPDPKPDTVSVTGVSLSQAEASIEIGKTLVLEATVSPSDATVKTVSWSSGDDKVAKVSDGTVTAVSTGNTTVTVTTDDGGFTATCSVTVVEAAIVEKAIGLNKNKSAISVLEPKYHTDKLEVSFVPVTTTDQTIVWTSDDESIVSVDDEGVITAVGRGRANVTATSKNGKTAVCDVTVRGPLHEWENGFPKGVTVTKFEKELGGGLTCTGAYAVIDFKANEALKFNVLFGSSKTIRSVDEDDDVDWYDSFEKGTIPVILTNGGYFDAQWGTSSAVVSDGKFRGAGAWSTGIAHWPGEYYPVRSALCQDKDGNFSCNWVYPVKISDTQRTIYTYPSALGQNDQTGVFLPAPPDASTPGAKKWENGYNLLQGGPRLVEEGRNVAWENTWAELLDGTVTNATKGDEYRTARTAAGITADGKLVLLVCNGDGRNGKNPAGFNMGELADFFISLGCVNATNFDGGGSSQMVGPDEGDIVPNNSSKGSMRAMPTAIAISEIQQ